MDEEFELILEKVKVLDLLRKMFWESLPKDCLECAVMPRVFWEFSKMFLENIDLLTDESAKIEELRSSLGCRWHVDTLKQMDSLIECFYKREFFNQGWKQKRGDDLVESIALAKKKRIA